MNLITSEDEFDRLPQTVQMREDLQDPDIHANEKNLEDMEAASRRLLEHAASFLSEAQLAALTRMETHKLEGQRRWVANLRAQPPSLGMARFVTAEPDPDYPP